MFTSREPVETSSRSNDLKYLRDATFELSTPISLEGEFTDGLNPSNCERKFSSGWSGTCHRWFHNSRYIPTIYRSRKGADAVIAVSRAGNSVEATHRYHVGVVM